MKLEPPPRSSYALRGAAAWEPILQFVRLPMTRAAAEERMNLVRLNERMIGGRWWRELPEPWRDAIEEEHAKHMETLKG